MFKNMFYFEKFKLYFENIFLYFESVFLDDKSIYLCYEKIILLWFVGGREIPIKFWNRSKSPWPKSFDLFKK